MLTDLDALRSSIDNFDLAIVCMFTERFRATRRIGEIKALAGMSATDQQREDLQLQRLKKAAAASEKDSDRERLMAMTKVTFDDIWSADGTTQPEHVCGYELGVFVELDIAAMRARTEFFERGDFTRSSESRF